MAAHVFQKGEKVFKRGYSGWSYTITLIDGKNAVLDNNQIVPLEELRPIVYKMSDGWYTFSQIPGFAYYIEWRDNEHPTYLWGLNFVTQKIEAVPKPFGSTLVYTGFDAVDFKPVKLTTQAL